MNILRFFAAVQAGDVLRDEVHGAGAIERDRSDDVVELMRLHVGQDTAHARTFHLEDAGHFTARQQTVSLWIVQGDVVQRVARAVPFDNQARRFAHDAQRGEAQEIHLEQADGFEHRKLILRHHFGDGRLLRAHERRVVNQRLVGHDDRCGVNGSMARDPFDQAGGFQQLLHLRLLVMRLLEVGDLLQRLFDADRLAGDVGDHLRHAVHVRQRNFHHAAHIAHRRPRLHAAKGDNLRHLVFAVAGDGVADHLFALIVGKVEVEVGHGDATWIQKALEDQVVGQRIEVGDTDDVGNDRASARAAHVVPDAAFPGVVAEVAHDQEVDIEAHLMDDFKLMFVAAAHGRIVRARAIALTQAHFGQVA